MDRHLFQLIFSGLLQLRIKDLGRLQWIIPFYYKRLHQLNCQNPTIKTGPKSRPVTDIIVHRILSFRLLITVSLFCFPCVCFHSRHTSTSVSPHYVGVPSLRSSRRSSTFSVLCYTGISGLYHVETTVELNRVTITKT